MPPVSPTPWPVQMGCHGKTVPNVSLGAEDAIWGLHSPPRVIFDYSSLSPPGDHVLQFDSVHSVGRDGGESLWTTVQSQWQNWEDWLSWSQLKYHLSVRKTLLDKVNPTKVRKGINWLNVTRGTPVMFSTCLSNFVLSIPATHTWVLQMACWDYDTILSSTLW